LNEFIEFIKGLGRYCILTCGDYDLHLLKKETTRKNIDIPKGLKFYINIKKGIVNIKF
jgi:3'-5' exoribonuclease 1